MKFEKAIDATELDEAKKEKARKDKLSKDPATLTNPVALKKDKKKVKKV